MPRTHLGAERPVLVRGEGCHVWDRDGRRYLDATSGAFCANLGYGRPDLLEAMARAAERLPHARPSSFDNAEAEGYRAELLAAAGPPFTRALLTSSGSEAVEAAMKIAAAYQRATGAPERVAVRSLEGHYHGATLGALGVTGWAERRAPWDALLPARREGLPAPGDGSAALIAETVPTAGLGVLVPSSSELAARRAACDTAGALWIADEILTGFGRCGALFAWRRLAEEDPPTAAAAAIPDLVVFGKSAGAGYAALAGVLVSSRVAEAIESDRSAAPFAHHQSHGGNPVACAVGRAVLRALSSEDLPARAAAREEERGRLLRVAGGAMGVRGLGALWAFATAAGADAGATAGEGPEALHRDFNARGILTHLAPGAAVVVAPPLTAGDDAWAAVAEAAARPRAIPSRGR
jgi:adenosylmethionine-8-amino-7-oxononanoate aminotransferase